MDQKNSIVVICRHKKDIGWTSKFVDNGFRVLIYDRKSATSNSHSPYVIDPEVGGHEASVYVRYILDYYEHLTHYTIFLQDDDHAWHHEGSIVDRVSERIKKKNNTKYFNLNNVCLGRIKENDLWPEMKSFFQKYLSKYLGDIERYEDFTAGNKCCAQFIVHESLIKQYPKEMYEGLYEYFKEGSKNSKNSKNNAKERKVKGHMLEWTWHLLFDNPFKNKKMSKKQYDADRKKATPLSEDAPCM